MKQQKEQFAVASVKAFIENEGKILILRESEKYSGGTNPGKYVMPGGKVNAGEHFLEALKREVKEECDMAIKIGRQFHVDEWRVLVPGKPGHIVGIYFHCSSLKSEVVLNGEFDEYKWINPRSYNRYPLNDVAKRAFKAFLDLKKR
jgi:8-oxo-dGTP diphosphatase